MLNVITEAFTLQFISSCDTQYSWYNPENIIIILKIYKPPNSAPTHRCVIVKFAKAKVISVGWLSLTSHMSLSLLSIFNHFFFKNSNRIPKRKQHYNNPSSPRACHKPRHTQIDNRHYSYERSNLNRYKPEA